MTAGPGLSRPALWAVPGEPDQLVRLDAFRAAHPDVKIYLVHRDVWQADISEPDGQTIITRYTLRELLDKLCELTSRPGASRASWEARQPPRLRADGESSAASHGVRG